MSKHVHTIFFKTHSQKLRKGIWPWNYGVRARLPFHYKLRFVQNCMTEFNNPDPVHYKEKTKLIKDKYGQKSLVKTAPIPVYFPRDADKGLWGGEGIIKCFKKRERNKFAPFAPKIIMPVILNRVFYSEILDKWMQIQVTRTTLNKIDDAFGFDNYVLKTPECHLKSRLGNNLKRLMLVTLARGTLYPEDPEKREKILKRYEKFIIPLEEAEWVGLSIKEAEDKQKEIEEAQRKAQEKPLKQVYARQLVDQLVEEHGGEAGGSSWLSKLNPFQDSKPKDQGTPV